MNTYSEMRNARQSNFDKLQKQLQTMNQGFVDDRFWKPTKTKANIASATFWFLPTPPQDGKDGTPFVRYWSHSFQGPTDQWYIEKSLTSINKADPVAEYNAKLWAEGEGSPGRKRVSGDFDSNVPGTKRKLNYVSNIYIASDSENSEMVGQVKLFLYGAQIFKKVEDAAHPKFPGYKSFDAFDIWNGAPLKLRVVYGGKKFNVPNYEKSEWDLVEVDNLMSPRGPLSEDDELLEKIWKSEYSLKEFMSPANFKTYNELKARLQKVLFPAEKEPEVEFTQTTPPWEDNAQDVNVPVETGEVDAELAMFRSLRDS